MLGLKRNTVHLFHHELEWENSALEVINELKEVLGNLVLGIEHVGSTAIKTILAKPIIDILVGVFSLEEINSYILKLKDKNIIYRESSDVEELLFVKGDFASDTRTHHIHVVKYGSSKWNNYILFRDYLNSNFESAKEYEKLKIELANKFQNDRKSYTKAKENFITDILAKAKINR